MKGEGHRGKDGDWWVKLYRMKGGGKGKGGYLFFIILFIIKFSSIIKVFKKHWKFLKNFFCFCLVWFDFGWVCFGLFCFGRFCYGWFCFDLFWFIWRVQFLLVWLWFVLVLGCLVWVVLVWNSVPQQNWNYILCKDLVASLYVLGK